MPAARPRNVEHYTSAILQTPPGESVNALPSAEVMAAIDPASQVDRGVERP